MSARISFNHPTGQPIQFNNNLEGQIQPPSRFYQNNEVPANNNFPPPRFNSGSGTFPGQNPPSQRDPVVIERERVEVKQIERPQFEKVYSAGYPNKKLGAEEDPPEKKGCCQSWCWALAALLGLAAITLALLFGLGVIGGSNNNSDSVAPIVISSTQANATANGSSPTSTSSTTTTTTTTATGTTKTNSTSTPSGVTGVSTNGGSSTSTTTPTTSGTTTTTGGTSGTSGVVPASISPIPA